MSFVATSGVPVAARQLDERGPDLVLLGHRVVHQLEVVVLGAEQLLVLADDALGALHLAGEDRLGHFAREAAREAR